MSAFKLRRALTTSRFPLAADTWRRLGLLIFTLQGQSHISCIVKEKIEHVCLVSPRGHRNYKKYQKIKLSYMYKLELF